MLATDALEATETPSAAGLTERAELLGMSRGQLAAWLVRLGAPAREAERIMRWMHHFGASRFAAMHDLSAALRRRLAACATLRAAPFSEAQLSADGTRKWLFPVDAGAVETVFIPQGRRGTLCVSSQAGCSLNCRFCATGRQGLQRNLTSAEIVAQVWHAHRALDAFKPGKDRAITNVVMMGMGEPLLNLDAVVEAISVLVDDFGYGLARSRVTVSTAGVVPAIEGLAERAAVSLAVSLHAPNDALRDVLVPINRKYPLSALLPAMHGYLARTNHRRDMISVAYTLIDGVKRLRQLRARHRHAAAWPALQNQPDPVQPPLPGAATAAARHNAWTGLGIYCAMRDIWSPCARLEAMTSTPHAGNSSAKWPAATDAASA